MNAALCSLAVLLFTIIISYREYVRRVERKNNFYRQFGPAPDFLRRHQTFKRDGFGDDYVSMRRVKTKSGKEHARQTAPS